MTIYGRTAVSGRTNGFTPAFRKPLPPSASVASGFWLRGNSIISKGGLITSWADEYGNYPGLNIVTGAPAFTASSAMYNNRPVSTWDGASLLDTLVTYPSNATLPQPCTAYLVGDTTGASTAFFFRSSTGLALFLSITASGSGTAAAAAASGGPNNNAPVLSSTAWTTGPHAICAIYNSGSGGASSIYVDSSSAPSGTAVTGNGVYRQPRIGGATPSLTGNIAEWIMLPGIDTPAQIAQMFGYFSTFYNLPWVR